MNSIGAGVIVAATLIGCDRAPAGGPSVPPGGSTQPATAPSTRAASTRQAGPGEMLIDGEPYDFPPAELVVGSKDDEIVGLFFTDDPPEAANDDYRGNSFNFEMTLDVSATGALAGATWDFVAPNEEWVDTITGIHLLGQKWVLQPFDVHVAVDGGVSPTSIVLNGTFLQFDNDDDQAPPKRVEVQARIPARVTVRPRQ